MSQLVAARPLAGVRLRPGSTGAALCVHALAQMPADVELELRTPTAVDALRTLASAYGVERRVDIGVGSFHVSFTRAGVVCSEEGREPVWTDFAALVERVSEDSPAVSPPPGDTEPLRGERVVVLTNYPASYRLPLLESLGLALEAAGAELTVLFLASESPGRPWLVGTTFAFAHAHVPSVRMRGRNRGMLIPTHLERTLLACRPTVVLSGGLSPFVSQRAARVAQSTGAAFGVWSGETATMPTARSRMRRQLRQRLVARADFAVAYGARSAAYLYGIRPDLPLVIGRNTAPTPERSPKGEGAEGTVGIVLVGDLANRRKGVDVALAALRLLPDADVRLVVIGSGRLLAELTEQGRADPRVTFRGSLPPEGVAAELAGADLLVFPTRSDVFGLALVEGMGAEAAPVVARAAGAVDDLAVDGHNALVVDGHEPESWATAIDQLSSDPERRQRLARRARRTVESRWTIGHATGAMVAGLALAVRERERRAA